MALLEFTRAATVAAVLFGLLAPPAVSGTPKPSIYFILTDDLGWNSVYHNNRTFTPFIDNLAATEGVKLTQHYTYKYCSPTRGAFLTGRMPYHLSATRANLIPWSLPDGINISYNMLPVTMRKAGYRSIHIGKWHQVRVAAAGGTMQHRTDSLDWQGFFQPAYTPAGRGFDYSFGFLEGGEDHWTSATFNDAKCKPNGVDLSYGWRNGSNVTIQPAVGQNGTYTGYLFADEAVRQIRAAAASQEPTFMYLALHNTHAPVEAPQRFIDLYNNTLWNGTLEATFNAQVSFVDEVVKNVTTELKSQGLWDNALVVWSTDNGAPVQVAGSNHPLRGGKGYNWEGGCRTPTFVTGGALPAAMRGKQLDGLAHVADWYATFAGLAGLPAEADPAGPAPPESLNLWPWISGQTAASPRSKFVYAHEMYGAGGDPTKAVGAIRDGDYKLIVGPLKEASWYGLFSPNSTAKPDLDATACSLTAPCLFNIKEDPTEHVDLSASQPERTQQMLADFHALSSEYHAPVHNPPQQDAQYCAAMHANRDFVCPWQADQQ